MERKSGSRQHQEFCRSRKGMQHDFDVIFQSQSNFKFQISKYDINWKKTSILKNFNVLVGEKKHRQGTLQFREPSIYREISP